MARLFVFRNGLFPLFRSDDLPARRKYVKDHALCDGRSIHQRQGTGSSVCSTTIFVSLSEEQMNLRVSGWRLKRFSQ
jgi:hypothetical protein